MKYVGTNSIDEDIVTQEELDAATANVTPKVTVSSTPPLNPAVNDIWVQIPE